MLFYSVQKNELEFTVKNFFVSSRSASVGNRQELSIRANAPPAPRPRLSSLRKPTPTYAVRAHTKRRPTVILEPRDDNRSSSRRRLVPKKYEA